MHYYNEFDPQAAAWLQVLIDQHLIPEGVVDTRSIVEVTAADLGGFVQCHFFAGIGGWPLALQLAGVPTSTRLWTGSCPCQPFSNAGAGKGVEDDRHLWPAFFALIRECKPELVFGEQVASAAVLGSSAKPTKRSAGKAVQPVWLDGVFADLESAGYACGSSDIPAAGVGAPHIRQRCWWGAVRLADAESARGWSDIGAIPGRKDEGLRGKEGENERRSCQSTGRAGNSSATEWMADSSQSGLEGHSGNVHDGNEPGRIGTDEAGSVAQGGESCGVGDADRQSTGRHAGSAHAAEAEHGTRDGDDHGPFDAGDGVSQFWAESRWHPCRDGKYRRVPVEPGLFPLADGLPYKVARRRTVRPPILRGAGNAICPEVGAEFVKAFYEVITP